MSANAFQPAALKRLKRAALPIGVATVYLNRTTITHKLWLLREVGPSSSMHISGRLGLTSAPLRNMLEVA
jgi:hypothetical protein